MRKRLLLILLLPLFLTGCWDKKDPEDRTFVISLGVDNTPDGCRFTFAPANIETGEAEEIMAESETLAGAVAEADTRTSRKTDLGQLKTIIFSTDVLKEQEKLESLLQELERSQVVSEKVMLLATEDSAADCVKAVMKEDGKTGLFLWDFYKNTAREVAVTKGTDLDVFLTERSERNGNAVLPRISVKEEKLELGGGVAITPEEIYPLSNKKERGYLFLLGEAEGALLEGGHEGEIIPLQIGRTDVKYEFSLQDGNILCRVTVPVEGSLQGGKGVFYSSEEQKKIEMMFEEIIKEEILHTLKTTERAGKDLYGILPRLYQAVPELTEGLSAETVWRRLVFDIQPEVELKDMGRKR